MKQVNKLSSLMLFIALLLSIIYPYSTASAKTADDYDWSGEVKPVFLYSTEDGKVTYSMGNYMDEWGIYSYLQGNFGDVYPSEPEAFEDSNFYLNQYYAGKYKMILAYGDKYLPLGSKAFGDWGTLDEALGKANLLKDEAIPFNFNFAGCKTTEEFNASVKSSSILVFDKDGRAQFRIPLSNFKGAFTDWEVANTSIKGASKVTFTVGNVTKDAKGNEDGVEVSVTWDFVDDATLQKVNFGDVCQGKLLSGDINKPSGTAVFKLTVSYNVGEVVCFAVDSNGNFYSDSIYIEDKFSSDVNGQVSVKTDPKAKDEVRLVVPKITVSKLPKSIEAGKSFKLIIKSDVKAAISLNGFSHGGYKTSSKFDITSNGRYYYTARSKSGGEATGAVDVDCFTSTSDKLETVSSFSRFGDNNNVNTLVQTGLSGKPVIVGLSLLILGIALLLYKKYPLIKGYAKKCGLKLKSFIAFLLVASMVAPMLSSVSASAGNKSTGTGSSGTYSSAGHSSSEYISQIQVGMRAYLVPAKEIKWNAKDKGKKKATVVRGATGGEIKDATRAAGWSQKSPNKAYFEYTVNPAKTTNYSNYKKYSKYAFYTADMKSYLNTNAQKEFYNLAGSWSAKSGDGEAFPTLKSSAKLNIGSNGFIGKANNWIKYANARINKRYAVKGSIKGQKKRIEQLKKTLSAFQNKYSNVDFMKDFKVETVEGHTYSNFYLVTEVVVGCVTKQGRKGLVTSRTFNLKGLSNTAMTGVNASGQCSEYLPQIASNIGAVNFSTCSLDKDGVFDITNSYALIKDASRKKVGGLGVHFGDLAVETPPKESNFAYIGAENLYIAYEGVIGNSGAEGEELDLSKIKTKSNFNIIKNEPVDDSGKDIDLNDRKHTRRYLTDSSGEPLSYDEEDTDKHVIAKKATGNYLKDSYHANSDGVTMSKTSSGLGGIGLSSDEENNFNSYSKVNRLYGVYNIAPVYDSDMGEEETLGIMPYEFDSLAKENSENIKKALRLKWSTDSFDSEGSAFGQGVAFKLKGAYAYDARLSHTGTDGGSNDNSGRGKLDSLGTYAVKLLNGVDYDGSIVRYYTLANSKSILNNEIAAPDKGKKSEERMNSVKYANYVLNMAAMCKLGDEESEQVTENDEPDEDYNEPDDEGTTNVADEALAGDTSTEEAVTDTDEGSDSDEMVYDYVDSGDYGLSSTKLTSIKLKAETPEILNALKGDYTIRDNGVVAADSALINATVNGEFTWECYGASPQVGFGIEVFTRKDEVKSQIVYIDAEGGFSGMNSVSADAKKIEKYETAEFLEAEAEEGSMYAVIVPNTSNKSAIKNESRFRSYGSESNLTDVCNALMSASGGDSALQAFKNYFGEGFTQGDISEGTAIKLGCEHISEDTSLEGHAVKAGNYGYTVYILRYTGPVAGEGALYLEDYELNHIWADYVYDAQDNANKLNGTNEAIWQFRVATFAEEPQNWTYHPSKATSWCCGNPKYRNKTDIECTDVYLKEEAAGGNGRLNPANGKSESLEQGHMIEWDNERINAGKETTYILYNTDRQKWSKRGTLVKGSGFLINLKDSTYNVTYAYNLIRANFGDVRTLSSISKENKNRTIGSQTYAEYCKDMLKLKEDDTPESGKIIKADKLVVDDGTALRNSRAKIAGDFQEQFITDAEFKLARVNIDGGSHIHSWVYTRWGSYPIYRNHDTVSSGVRKQLSNEFYRYSSEGIEKGGYAWFIIHEFAYKYLTVDDTKTGGSDVGKNMKVPTDQLLTSDALYPAADLFASGGGMKKKDEYRISYTKLHDDVTLKYYPEVPMGAWLYTGRGISTNVINNSAQVIITMGEQLRKSQSSSLYLFRVRKGKAEGADEVEGSVLSDNFVTDDETAGVSGTLPSIYAGGDVTVKADPNFYIDLYGYGLDIVKPSDNGKMKGVDKNGSDVDVLYKDIIDSGQDAAADWGNDADSDEKLKEHFEEWAGNMLDLKNFAADARLEITNPNKTYSNFNAVVGSVEIPQGKNGDNPKSKEEFVYPLIIQRGELVKSDNVNNGIYKNGYKRLIKQIAKDYGLTDAYGETEGYARAEKVFEASGLYTSIIDSIESSSGDSRNKSQKSPASAELGSEDHWYDEEMRTLVVRRYKLVGNKVGEITLQDKIDYGAAPGADSSTSEGNMSRLAGAKWYLTVYFGKEKGKDTVNVKPLSTDALMGSTGAMSIYDPADLTSSANARNTYNILVDGAHINGADFNIPAGTTDNTEW